jgi:hypothetical protein
MGVYFSHGNARWSYGGFNDFRKKLALEIGIDLDKMIGFGGYTSWDTVDDHIVPLLNHSDCDGDLTPEECRLVAPRLRQLITMWDEDNWHKERAYMLAGGMDMAAEADEELVFC